MSCIGKRLTRTMRGGGRLRLRAAAVMLLGAGGPGVVSAQAPIALRGAGDVHPQEFTNITSVRELSDGRVLVADIREQVLRVLDYERKSSASIGRTGEGPGEYRSPLGLYPLAADSTLLTDGTSRRWFILAGTSIVQTITADQPLPRDLGAGLAGSDLEGHVLVDCDDPCVAPLPGHDPPDSVPILMLDRATERIVTLGRLRVLNATRENDVLRTIADGRTVHYGLANLFQTRERAVLFPDGWIAIARLEPYRVDWRRPDGTIIRAAPLPDTPVRITAREEEFAIDRQYGDLRVKFRPEDFPQVGDFLPPFPRQDLLVAPDDDGIQHLRRQPWP